MTATLETVRWLPALDPEDTLPATDDGANDNRQRPIRMTNALWDDFGLVADVLKVERSALIRNFVRWSIGDDSVKPPTRPDVMPEGMRFVPLPDGVEYVIESEARQISKPRTRYIVRVDGAPEAVRAALIDSDEAKDALYTQSSPVQVSTFDRDHMLRILDVLANAGLTVVTP
jgi:hypothetical protein